METKPCCELCKVTIRNSFGEKMGYECKNPNCNCHKPITELKELLEEFDNLTNYLNSNYGVEDYRKLAVKFFEAGQASEREKFRKLIESKKLTDKYNLMYEIYNQALEDLLETLN